MGIAPHLSRSAKPANAPRINGNGRHVNNGTQKINGHANGKTARSSLKIPKSDIDEFEARCGRGIKRPTKPKRQNHTELDWPDVNDKGVKGRSQINIEYFLDHAGVALSFDLMAQRAIVTRNGESVSMTDDIASGLWLEADRLGLPSAYPYFCAVLEDTARKGGFHPIRDYIDGLEWDGVPRLDEWLSAYLGADDTELNSAYGRKHLIAAVRRVRKPGVKFDTILVLQGPQGKGKSSAIKALCPDEEYFGDNLIVGADQKEVIEQTSGKWLVELPELDGISRKEASSTKSMLSRQVDKSRLAYGRLPIERPRQFVFFGTVNDSHFLHDTTGNRRFWPVAISGVLNPDEIVANITRDRDQLWAEAAHYEAKGESLTLPRNLWDVAAESQQERMVIDPWHERLLEKLDDSVIFMPSEDVYTLLGIPSERRNGNVGQRIAGILTGLGFKRTRRRWDGSKKQIWGYAPIAAEGV